MKENCPECGRDACGGHFFGQRENGQVQAAGPKTTFDDKTRCAVCRRDVASIFKEIEAGQIQVAGECENCRVIRAILLRIKTSCDAFEARVFQLVTPPQAEESPIQYKIRGLT